MRRRILACVIALGCGLLIALALGAAAAPHDGPHPPGAGHPASLHAGR